MNLKELMQGIEVISMTGGEAHGGAPPEITGLAYDSRQVKPGYLFFALRGFNTDGHRFVSDAVQKGAACVISEKPADPHRVAWLRVSDARASMARAAANFYRHPSRDLMLVGVTGTNGKTTTVYLMDSIFRAVGASTAMLGTIGRKIGGEQIPAEHTTPEAPDVQSLLRRAVDAGCRFGCMEVSSHALELRRSDFLDFKAAIFTNLTRDHLDFHRTFENYYAAKRRFFVDPAFGNPIRVVNRDDAYGDRLWNEVGSRRVSFGVSPKTDYQCRDLSLDQHGIAFQLSGKRSLAIRSSLIGLPNVYNILGACAAALELGVEGKAVQKGVQEMQTAPGRMEPVQNSRGLHIYVDYAHTDDALRNVLQLSRPLTRGKLIVLFGCGGDRDRTKRPVMGKVAAQFADYVVITTDNPRTEDPDAILDAIEPSVKITSTPYVRIRDRREAIRHAVGMATDEDTVILAGKGHEDYQVIGTQKIPFSDKEEAQQAIEDEK